ncbi:DUF692 domain-containing protein [Polyangium mundeleinium]|uniref:DUF692 domain-containing protein n=1 Tax=Polyangium mundeleinium TaxID=2995306 RepID=A0ABT5F532_9BACT|nr:DUF692 domain-containing protein [Polyangium mundeleinium]MDC0749195.1 DUF692 domain-containing protein [Polyangium mundeleinium]
MLQSSAHAIPHLGSGLGFRRRMKSSILAHRDSIDFIEITTEHFMTPRQLDELEALCALLPCVPHGLQLSVGSTAPPTTEYLRCIKKVLEVTGAPYYSDHLAITSAPGIDLGHLSPIVLTRSSLESIVRNISTVQDHTGKLLIVENISYFFDIPQGELSHTDLLNEIVERTGCGLLLDATNLYTNATNHGYDPIHFLEQIPLDRVIQVHMAGGVRAGGLLFDSHSHAVEEGSWDVLRALALRTDVKGVIIERDDNYPPIEELLVEITKARDILETARKQREAAQRFESPRPNLPGGAMEGVA